MGIFATLREEGRGRRQRRVRARLQGRRAARRDRGPAAARARRRGQAHVSGQAAGAQRVRRRPVPARPRQAGPVRQDPDAPSWPPSSRATPATWATSSTARSCIHLELDEGLPTGRFTVGLARPWPASDGGPTDQPATTAAINRARLVLEVNGMRHPLEPPGLDHRPRHARPTCGSTIPGISRWHAEIRVSGPGPSSGRHRRPRLDQRHRRQRPAASGRPPSRTAPGSRSARPGCWCTHPPGAEACRCPRSPLTVIKVLFLALLWLFILSAVSVIRSDLFGGRAGPRPAAAAASSRPRRRRRRRPSGRGRPPDPRHHPGQPGRAARPSWPTGWCMIGRGADCQLILDDDYVSTRHAARRRRRERLSTSRTSAPPTAPTSTASGSPRRPRSPWPTPYGSARPC